MFTVLNSCMTTNLVMVHQWLERKTILNTKSHQVLLFRWLILKHKSASWLGLAMKIKIIQLTRKMNLTFSAYIINTAGRDILKIIGSFPPILPNFSLVHLVDKNNLFLSFTFLSFSLLIKFEIVIVSSDSTYSSCHLCKTPTYRNRGL